MPAGSDHWPGWHHDHQTADYWTTRLAGELEQAFSAAQAQRVARDYKAERPGPRDGWTNAELTAAALAWLATQHTGLAPAIAGVMTGLRTDAALIGAAAATAALAGGTTANVGTWQPGRTSAATELLRTYDPDSQPSELSVGDDDPDVQGITDTRTGKLARALALGALKGLAVASLASSLREALVADLAAITLTEVIRASSKAAMGVYGRKGVQSKRWLTDPRSNICPACLQNEAAGAIPIGQLFPSGQPYPPLHVRCACAVVGA